MSVSCIFKTSGAAQNDRLLLDRPGWWCTFLMHTLFNPTAYISDLALLQSFSLPAYCQKTLFLSPLYITTSSPCCKPENRDTLSSYSISCCNHHQTQHWTNSNLSSPCSHAPPSANPALKWTCDPEYGTLNVRSLSEIRNVWTKWHSIQRLLR